MKNSFIIPFILTCVVSSAPVVAQTKHALIFAIGNYPEERGWQTISSIKDAEVIFNTLSNQQFTDIRVYRDSQATISGIDKAFNDLINDKNLHEGDIVVIHFSTHGSQVEDDNGDEVDGLDESIVAYDAVSLWKADKKDFEKIKQGYFRDDQFGKYILQLRNKLGKNGDIIVFIDACHSGSGTRGTAKVRGDQPPIVSEKFDVKINPSVDSKSKGVFREKNSSTGDDKNLATYIVFSAARSDELDYEAEGKELGSLSYAIGKVFEQLDAGTTYRSLFSKLQSVMLEVTPPNQHPVMEGNGTDRELFGGKYIKQKPYVEVSAINGNLVTIKAGLLSGLNIGTKVIVLPSGTNDPKGLISLASGTVTSSSNFNAIVTLDKNLGKLKPVDVWIFITEPVFTFLPVTIGFSPANSRGYSAGFSETEINIIKEQLKDIPVAGFNGKPELLIEKNKTGDSIQIKITTTGYTYNTIKATDSPAEKLKEEIKRYSQYKFLRDIEIKDPDAQVEIKLVPVIDNKADTSKIESNIVNGIYEFNEGDKFVVWMKNKSDKPVYVNILDLQPNGIINPIFPDKKKLISSTDLKIGAGDSCLFSQYPIKLSPPYGMEIFKIFVSNELIDMEVIANSNGAESRGNFNALTRLVKYSYTITSRGGVVENLDNSDGSTFNLLFRIKKKE